MALHQLITVLIFALALSTFKLSTCQVLKAKLSCLDCKGHFDFSGIKVLVKCDHVKKLAMATADNGGSFKVELPSDYPLKTPSPLKCHAKLFGGEAQLYASKKNMVSEVVKAKESSAANSYTISTPLAFSISCPSNLKCAAKNNDLGSSKTVDLPLPVEWGLAPSSYYVPFVPIIGIP